MFVNFKARKISRDMRKLTRRSTLKKKKNDMKLHFAAAHRDFLTFSRKNLKLASSKYHIVEASANNEKIIFFQKNNEKIINVMTAANTGYGPLCF